MFPEAQKPCGQRGRLGIGTQKVTGSYLKQNRKLQMEVGHPEGRQPSIMKLAHG